MENTNKKMWFKRKTYGYGWTPVTWEGWMVVLVYVAAILLSNIRFNQFAEDPNLLIRVVFTMFPATVVLIGICMWKGEKPKWQWGNKD